MIKAIVFDLWQTLADEPFSLEEYWEPALKKYPEKITPELIHPLAETIYMKQPLSPEDSVASVFKELKIKEDKKVIQQVADRWTKSVRKAKLYPDVISSLKKLRQAGYKLALITNTSKVGWEQLDSKYNLSNKFDIIAKSYELGMSKPEIDIFRYVESELLIPTSKILMIGDSFKNDVQTPRFLGWKALQIIRPKEAARIKPKDRDKEYIKGIETLIDILK